MLLKSEMLTSLYLIIVAVSFVVSQYDFEANRVVPMYIQRALRKKDKYKPIPHAKKMTMTNLTLAQVFEKIQDITGALNKKAKKNGFKVDYKLRIV